MLKSSDKRAAFLDGKEINDAIIEVATLAAQDNIKVALIGGAALQLYGSDRFTRDVDIVATAIPGGLKARGEITFGGKQMMTAAGTPVDVTVRDDDVQALYEEALARAERVQGVAIPVVTLPYLAAMKLEAGRPKDELDLAFILGDTDVDYAKVRAVTKKFFGHYGAKSMDSFKSEVDWKKAR